MSQTILPPSPQPEPQPPAQPQAQPPAYYYPTYGAPSVVVAEPTPPGYQPDPPKKQALIWRIIKWPIRQVFKAIYLIGRAASNHKVIGAILLIILVALIGAGVVGYRYLNPPPKASTSSQAGAISTALEQSYLRNQLVNSEEGAPMGVGIWYEMQVADAEAFLFKNADPAGSLDEVSSRPKICAQPARPQSAVRGTNRLIGELS